jgi:hypothetical protein
VTPLALPTAPSSHAVSRPGDEGGPGGLAATMLAIALVLGCLIWLAQPWKRSKLPRARATITRDDHEDADREDADREKRDTHEP